MGKVVLWFVMIWALLASCALVSYLFKSENWPMILAVACVGIAFLTAIVMEKWRRKREGYYVYKRGGADGGILIYDERGHTLQFYFNRRSDTIYVPSDAAWNKIMPSWAKERKDEVLTRIKSRIGKRLVGKSWTYEETDKPEFVLIQ
jgi:hypothetical protein